MKSNRLMRIVANILSGGAGLMLLMGCGSEPLKPENTPIDHSNILTIANLAKKTDKKAVIPLNELKAQADALLKQSNVSTRDGISIVFNLVDRLLEENQRGEAEEYIVKGLSQYPWNLKYQMIYSEMLANNGKREKAEEKASLVYKYAETDDLIERAAKVLGKTAEPNIVDLKSLPGTNHCIVLIPFQGCDKWLIGRIQKELSSTLGVPVSIQTINVAYPQMSRDRRGCTINFVRKNILKTLQDMQIVECMKALKLSAEDLKNEGNVIKMMQYLARMSDPEEEKQLKAFLVDSIGKDPQWDADQLLETLGTGVKQCRRENIAYLGITPVDIYSGDYNFLFGLANKAGGVMSYHRFTAEFNDETPNQDRLVKRAVMQCLSSIGFEYGIKRCTDPTCARAYPNSLREHDAKTGSLCLECRDGFKRIFGQNNYP